MKSSITARHRKQITALGKFWKGKKRRPLTEAEKDARRKKSLVFWHSPAAKALRAKAGLRLAAYNKDPESIAQRLKPDARRRAGERLTHINKTRPRSAKERLDAAKRMSQRVLAGKCKRGPLSDTEKEFHRKKAIGNVYFGGKRTPMSAKARRAASLRMKRNNPMRNKAAAARMADSKRKKYGDNYHSEHFKRMWREGKIVGGRKISLAERKAASKRMKARNPMKRPEVVDKVRKSLTPERRAAMAARIKQTWAEGKIVPLMYSGKGNVRSINKMESQLLPMVTTHGGKFVGDGSFWIHKTNSASGIARNPDFIFGSGKTKTALLLHGQYWHRDQEKAAAEIEDYRADGWNLFVLWVNRHIAKWVMPEIEKAVVLWLAECSQSNQPIHRQFMTWNATRTTTSSPAE